MVWARTVASTQSSRTQRAPTTAAVAAPAALREVRHVTAYRKVQLWRVMGPTIVVVLPSSFSLGLKPWQVYTKRECRAVEAMACDVLVAAEPLLRIRERLDDPEVWQRWCRTGGANEHAGFCRRLHACACYAVCSVFLSVFRRRMHACTCASYAMRRRAPAPQLFLSLDDSILTVRLGSTAVPSGPTQAPLVCRGAPRVCCRRSLHG